VAAYREADDALFERLLAKVGRSGTYETLFSHQPNDIAVGVENILGVGQDREVKPSLHNVACHHLNYFDSAAGQAALRAVDWQ
jgi:hypothetical protein